MSNPTFTITVMAGFDGGRIIYESVIDEYGTQDSRLVFGGNPEEASQYVAKRISEMTDAPAPQKEQFRIEPPMKVRARKVKDHTNASLDALELMEGDAD